MRFGLAGVVGLVVDAGTLVALRSGAGWGLAPATATAFALGLVANYALVRGWAFGDTARRGEGGRALRYLALAALNAVLSVLVVSGLAGAGLDYRLAKAVAVVLLFGTNYLLVSRFVLAGPGDRPNGRHHARSPVQRGEEP